MADDIFAGGGLWLFAILALMWGGNFGGFGNAGFANAIGYQNLATQNDVQRGFDNQNNMANQREILSAVTNGTTQSVAAVNQAKYDLATQIAGVANMETAINDKIQACCCETQRAIDGVNFNNAINTAAINSKIEEKTQKILDKLSQDKIEALQGRIQQLELQQATQNVVKYPTNMTYTAGYPMFCNCGYNGLYA